MKESERRKSVQLVFRWVILLPTAFLGLFFMLFLGAYVQTFIDAASSTQTGTDIAFSLHSGVMAASFLCVGTFVAPIQKKKTLWVLYFLGSAISIAMFRDFTPLPIVVTFAVGFVPAVLIHRYLSIP